MNTAWGDSYTSMQKKIGDSTTIWSRNDKTRLRGSNWSASLMLITLANWTRTLSPPPVSVLCLDTMSHARSPSYSRYSLVQAELIAMNIAAQETVWLRNMMCEINALRVLSLYSNSYYILFQQLLLSYFSNTLQIGPPKKKSFSVGKKWAFLSIFLL